MPKTTADLYQSSLLPSPALPLLLFVHDVTTALISARICCCSVATV